MEMTPGHLKPSSVTVKWLAKHAVCTTQYREIGGNVPIFTDGDFKCPLPRSVIFLGLELRSERVMTYSI